VLVHWDAAETREGGLEVGKLQGVRPVVFVGCAKDFKYFEDLVDFTVAHEQGTLLCHFCKDAACRPEIHSERIMFLAQQNFWAAIPKSDDLVCIGFDREAKRPCESEIGQLNGLSVVADKKVLGLEVTVENSV